MNDESTQPAIPCSRAGTGSFPPDDLAAQLENACKEGMINCKPVRILPGGGKTRLGDYVVYFNFLEEDGSLYVDPDGFSILNSYVSEGEDGLLKISYLP